MKTLRNFKTILQVLLISGMGLLSYSMMMADDIVQEPWEKAAFKAGGFISAFDSSVEFGINKIGGIKIDAETVLGLDASLAVFRGNAMIRPGKSRRHQFDVDYASYNRHASKTLTEGIEIDGEVLLPGTRIQSTLDIDIVRGTYSYAFLQDDRMRIALGLGVYVVPLRYGVDISEPNDPRELEFRDVTLPLPSLALRGDFQLVPRLFLTTEINAMYLEIDSYSGSLIDVSMGLEYRPWKHLGVGMAYSAMSVHVEAEESSNYPGANFVGAVDVNFTGLQLYAKLMF